MLDLRRQQAAVQRQLATEVAGEIEAVRARYDAARLREAGLRRKLAQQERTAVALRELGSRYDLLKSDADSARALRESLLKQRMATEVNAQLAAFTVRMVERSEVPRRPSRPSVPLNLTLGIAAGLVFAVGSVFVCEYFDNSVKSSDDVEGFLELPTLATILRDQFCPRHRRKYLFPQPTDEREIPWATGACLLFRRTAFQTLGGFDEHYSPANEYPDGNELPEEFERTGFRSCRCCSTNNKSGQPVLGNFVASSKFSVFLTRIKIEPSEREFE